MLNGRTVLIVEGEFLIALDFQRMLEALGIGQTLFARDVAEAETLRERWPEITLAIVEIRGGPAATLPLIDSLGASGVACVLTTGDVETRSALARPDRPVLIKPVPEDVLASAVAQALAARS